MRRKGKRRAAPVLRRISCLLLGLICLAAPSTYSHAGAQQTEQALIRFVLVSPDAPPMDIYMDGQIVVKGVEFPTATAFLAFSVGDHRFQWTPAESTVDGALIDIDQNLDADTSYEIVAIGLLNDVEAQVFEVDTSVMDSPNNARLRLIQGAPSLGGVDVVVEDGDTLFEDVDFPDASDYREVGPSTSNLLLYGTGQRDILARLDGLDIESGWVYDVFIAGQSENETLQFLALKAPAVASCAQILGGENPDDGCARFVNASQVTQPLQVYVDEATEPTSTDLARGQATGFVGLPEGIHRLRLVPERESVEQAILDVEFDVSSREVVEVVVLGDVESLAIGSFRTSLAPLPAGQARLRIVHALDETDAVDVVMADGSILFETLGYSEGSTYAAVAEGTISFQARIAGEDAVVVPLTEIKLEAGMVYDVVIVGRGDDPDGTTLIVLDSPSVSAREHEGIQPAGGDAAPPVASPEIVPTATPTPEI